MSFIEVKNLTKYFTIFKRSPGLKGAIKSFINRKYEDFYAVNNCSLNIEKGEIIGILGENGAGKTTLTQLLAKHFKWEAQLEDVVDNPYLDDFYNQMELVKVMHGRS